VQWVPGIFPVGEADGPQC